MEIAKYEKQLRSYLNKQLKKLNGFQNMQEMRISEFDKALERAWQTCGMDAAKDKLAKRGII